jgi:hypothetical protein
MGKDGFFSQFFEGCGGIVMVHENFLASGKRRFLCGFADSD